MGISESIDEVLASRSAGFARRCLVTCLLVVFLLDLSTALALRAAPSFVRDGTPHTTLSWTPQGLIDGLRAFRSDAVDMMLLSIVRVLVMVPLVWLGIRVGKPKLDDLIAEPGGTGGASTSTAPLLINAGPAGGEPSTATCHSCCSDQSVRASRSSRGPGHGTSRTAGGLTLTHEVKEEHLLSHQRKEKAELRKNVVCGAMFLFASALQVYMGVKCIGFDPDWSHHPRLKSVQTVLFLVSLALVNLESFLGKRMVMVCTKEDGFFIPEFHPHRLFFNPKITLHKCDMCRNRITQAYQCKLCNWDCCAACFNKKDKATGEGIIRGDKGVKDVRKMSFSRYAAKGVRLIAPELPLFILALALLATNSTIRLFMPNYQGSIMDNVVNAHHACLLESYNHTIAPNITGGSCAHHQHEFLTNVLIYFGLSFATSVLSALRQLCFMLVGRRIILHIRDRVFESVLLQDIAFFDGMRTGDLQQRMSSDVRSTASPIFSALPTLLSNLILLIGGVVMCFVVSWRLSMLAFTTVLPIMHVTRSYAEWSSKINREIYQDFADGNAIANEAVSNIRTIRAASSEDFEINRYRDTLKKAFGKGIKDATIGAFATFLNGSLDLGAGCLILWFGGSIAMQAHGTISVGDLIKYQLYYNMMNNSIQALSGILNNFTRAAGAAERVLSVIELQPDIDPFAGAPVDVAVRTWDLQLDRVAFTYQMRPGNKVLHSLSFAVAEGNVCALVGPSGGGKSTVMHLLLRFYDPPDGTICLGGVPYGQLNLRSVHSRIGCVSQETQLFNDTIAGNITYGAPADVSDDDVEAAARAAQAWDFISTFEDGMQTKCGERGQRLSGGQKQRIAIARCLLRQPKLLLLDEATSALDAASEAAVQKAIDHLIWQGQHTVVLVAHRLSTVVNANNIVVIQKGTVVEEGSHLQLLEKEGVYAELVKTQLQQGAAAGGGEADADGQGGG